MQYLLYFLLELQWNLDFTLFKGPLKTNVKSMEV
jgi:hypothetical protein